jgi:hypothetical protein
MSAIGWSLDTPAKRWLALLAVAFLVSMGVLVHSFLDSLTSPQQKAEATPKPALESAEQVQARSEPVWNAPPPEPSHTTERVSPFAAQDAVEARTDPAARQKIVHHQAEYLRGLIASGRLPKQMGNLTKEQVDQMEKDGITIE